jgi:hypothetical protein
MSRKHFVAVAADFKILLDGLDSPEARFVLEAAARRLCDTFAECNARFDRARFLRACGF